MHPKKTTKKEEKGHGKSNNGNKQLHKYLEDTRDKITPYFYGEKLKLDQELVTDGFPAITNKVIALLSSQGIIDLQLEDGDIQKSYMIQRRNSFIDLHNPDLSRLDCRPKPSFEESEEFFRNYIIAYGLLHTSSFMCPFEGNSGEIKAITTERDEIYKDEDIPQVLISSRTIQISDDDLDNPYVLHRSPADFCVTVGCFSKRDVERKSKTRLVRWASNVNEEERVKEEEIKETSKHKKVKTVDGYNIENITSSTGIVAVGSIHSFGNYSESDNVKDGVFSISGNKKGTGHQDVRKFDLVKKFSFASIHTTKSNETVTTVHED